MSTLWICFYLSYSAVKEKCSTVNAGSNALRFRVCPFTTRNSPTEILQPIRNQQRTNAPKDHLAH